MLHDSRGKGFRSGHFSSETCKKKLKIKGDAKLDPFPPSSTFNLLLWQRHLAKTGAKRIEEQFCKKIRESFLI